MVEAQESQTFEDRRNKSPMALAAANGRREVAEERAIEPYTKEKGEA
jgi:hypothetical protein